MLKLALCKRQNANKLISSLQQLNRQKRIFSSPLLATNLFQTPLTITILQEPLYQYRDNILKDLEDSTKHLWINPAELVTESITNLINYPGVQDLVKIQDSHHVLRTQIEDNHPLVKKNTKELEKQLPEHSTIVAIIREGNNLDLEHTITLKKDDQIIIACRATETKGILKTLTSKTAIHRVILAGITSISQSLINKIPAHCSTKIIDNNLEKATRLAQTSEQVTVLHGDINDTELLVNEKIDQTDAFFTLSHDDEDNLVAALQAKRHHVPIVASLVHRQEIAPIIDENNIHTIEPQKMLTNYIYQIIHQQTVQQRNSLHQKAGEIISIKIPKSLDKKPLRTLKLPKYSQPFYLFREKKALPIKSSQILSENDTLCLYVKSPQDVKYVTEQLKVPKETYLTCWDSHNNHVSGDPTLTQVLSTIGSLKSASICKRDC